MECKIIEKKLLDFIENNVKDEEKLVIEEHIKNCEQCKTLYKDFLVIIEKAADIKVPEFNITFWKNKLEECEYKKAKLSFRKLALMPVLTLLFIITLSVRNTRFFQSWKINSLEQQYELDIFSDEKISEYIEYISDKEAEVILEEIFGQKL